MDGTLRLSDWVQALRRRLWIVLVSVGTLAPLSLAIAYFLPPRYEATALILVESQQIRPDLVGSVVTTSASERLQVIQQKLMTRENLLALIERMNLYADRRDLTPTEKVALVRANTRIEDIAYDKAPRGQQARLAAFTLTFTSQSGPVAARVANDFADTIVRQNAEVRTSQAVNTLGFLSGEVSRLSDALLALEREIAAYKGRNELALPESITYRRDELAALRQRRFEREAQRLQVEEQLRIRQRALETGAAALVSGTPETQEERDLAGLRRVLIQKRALLSESHPEIVALKARIAAIETLIAPAPVLAGEDPALLRLRAEIAAMEKQLELLAEQQTADNAREVLLEQAIADMPQVEMALNVYNRRYGELKAQYEIAVRKLAEASSGEKLESNQQAERFTVIESAQVPERPAWPNRALIAAGGGAASLVIGLGLAVLLELLNRSIRTAHALETRVGLRPIVSIPYVMTAGERRRRALLVRAGLFAALVVVPALLFLVHQYVMPLDALLARIVERTGIETVIRHVETRLGR